MAKTYNVTQGSPMYSPRVWVDREVLKDMDLYDSLNEASCWYGSDKATDTEVSWEIPEERLAGVEKTLTEKGWVRE